MTIRALRGRVTLHTPGLPGTDGGGGGGGGTNGLRVVGPFDFTAADIAALNDQVDLWTPDADTILYDVLVAVDTAFDGSADAKFETSGLLIGSTTIDLTQASDVGSNGEVALFSLLAASSGRASDQAQNFTDLPATIPSGTAIDVRNTTGSTATGSARVWFVVDGGTSGSIPDWQAYTPIWYEDGVPNAEGSGTLTGEYLDVTNPDGSHTVDVRIQLICNNDRANAGGPLTVSYPSGPPAPKSAVGSVFASYTGSGTAYTSVGTGTALISDATAPVPPAGTIELFDDFSDDYMQEGSPIAFATGAIVVISIRYHTEM